jgi:hypothetical protein
LLVFLITQIAGGKKNSQIVAQTSAPTSSAPTTSAPQKEVNIEELQVPPLSIYRRRNPFKPLVNMEAPQQTAAATGTGGVVVVPNEIDPNSTNPVISKVITLEGIFEENGNRFARIRVADELFEKVAKGEVFANNYKLLSIDGDSSATILYGDERFTIYVGQSLYW